MLRYRYGGDYGFDVHCEADSACRAILKHSLKGSELKVNANQKRSIVALAA